MLSCALLTSERGMRGRVVATARDFRFFFSIFFSLFFFFCSLCRGAFGCSLSSVNLEFVRVLTACFSRSQQAMYNAEKRGKRQVLVRPVSKVVIKFLQVMQKHGTFTFSFSTKRDETRVRREGETLMEFFFSISLRRGSHSRSFSSFWMFGKYRREREERASARIGWTFGFLRAERRPERWKGSVS